MLQVASSQPTEAEKNYTKAANALMQHAAFYAQAGFSPKAIQEHGFMQGKINEFKTARKAFRPEDSPETVLQVMEEVISQGRSQKISLQTTKLNSASVSATQPDMGMKVVAVVADAKGATPNVKYTPKKNEGLAAIAAQQPLVVVAKESVCNGKTDDKSAELVTAIAIARHNPAVEKIDLIRQDLPLTIPNVAQFEKYVAQIKQTGLLANCHIGYAADVQGRNVADFFPAQRAPIMASLKTAAK